MFLGDISCTKKIKTSYRVIVQHLVLHYFHILDHNALVTPDPTMNANKKFGEV